jgi:DNA ligase-1
VKHHITSAKLLKANLSDTPIVPCPPTLSELLETLSNRQVTGTEAVKTVIAFLQANNIESPDDEYGDGLTLKEVFLRVLDKNLKAGVAGKTLKAVDWEAAARSADEVGPPGKGAYEDGVAAERTTLNPSNESRSIVSTSLTTIQDEQLSTSLLPPTRLPYFSCALGKTILRKDLDRVLSLPSTASASPTSAEHPKWLASRKLDGVRLLVVVDVRVPDAADGEGPEGVQVGDIWTLSRSGREYFSLDVLKRQLRETLSGWLGLLDILRHETRYTNSDGQGYIQRLVLDGELCHLIDDPTTAHPAEDFTQVVSMVRRKDYTIQRPTMFLLDVVPWSVFVDGMEKGGDGSAEEYKVFANRAKDCAAVVERVERRSLELGAEPMLRKLEQRAVGSIQEVEEMIGVAVDRGWEGLVIRRGDMPYEGKRR